MYLLGVHNGNHDASACLFRDYELIAAVSLERLTRKKNDGISPAMLTARRLERRRLGARQSVTACEGLDPGVQRGERGRGSATFFGKGVAHFEWAVSHLTPVYEPGRRQGSSARA